MNMTKSRAQTTNTANRLAHKKPSRTQATRTASQSAAPWVGRATRNRKAPASTATASQYMFPHVTNPRTRRA